ncbi:MAG: GNAT family N-acetyltransferase [Ruminococcaceae bacterium]|nr:GNAT family N-acetyltransferase [Oscillospiraceae bacterium]
MAMLEYIKHSSQCENYKKILTLREKSEKDEKAFHISCVIGDDIIACGSLAENEKGIFEIYGLFVKEHYRNNGLGTEIIKCFKQKAKESKATEIFAELPLDAVRFFEKNQMAVDGVSYKKGDKRVIKCSYQFIFDDAQWVTFGGERDAVIVRKDFELDEVKETILYASGLGFCEIYINGQKISDRLLAPAWTNYVSVDSKTMSYPIFDKMTNRILYEKSDVTSFLKEGKNTIVFHIGGGWFCQYESIGELAPAYGDLMLCFKIMQGEKQIAESDDRVRYTKSYIRKSNVYYGEEHDARIGNYDFENTDYSIESWKKAEEIKRPLSILQEQDCIPDKVIRTLKPKCIYSRGDIKLYDIGENVSGYAVIKFHEDTSHSGVCDIRYAENINEDFTLNFDSAGWESRVQRDRFIRDKKKTEFHTRFTWHAARYFEVIGDADVVEYRVTHTDLKQKVNFKSSNETLQWIFDAFIRTQLSNTHGCIPSDCPHRERLGYTGDGQLACEAVMTCFDAEKMYRKWMQDVADCQDIYNGHVQHTAPFRGGGGGPGGWGGAIVFVPYSFYKFYKDKEILSKYYDNMLNFLDYMEDRSENGLVVREEAGGWCLGDWCSPDNKNLIPEPFVNTYFLIKAFKQVVEISEILEKDTTELKARLEKITKAFVDAYYDEKTGAFCSSLEASDAYAYDIGLGDERTLKAIVDKYEALSEFDTGIFGTDILIRVLCENGHKDLAFKLLTSEKENTFYNMKKHGATTLWENWNGEASHSHPMFGAVVQYIVKYFNEA